MRFFNKNIETNRDLRIETMKGFAIILVVYYHAGLYYSDSKPLDFFFYLFDGIRMPLFTAISGYLYALRPVHKDSLFQFIFKKSRRLLVPLFSMMTIWLVLSLYFEHLQIRVTDWTSFGLFKFYFGDLPNYWFIYAIFINYLIVAVLDCFKQLEKINTVLFLIILTFLIGVLVNSFEFRIFNKNILPLFSFDGAMYLLPYFLLGLLISRFRDLKFSKILLPLVFTVFIVVMTFHVLKYEGAILTATEKRTSIRIFLIGITSVFMIFRFNFKSSILANLGQYTFPIFLFHILAFQIVQNNNISIGEIDLRLLIIVISGLIIPIFIHHIFIRNRITRLLFLGITKKI